MNVLETMKNRVSYRGKFADTLVPRNDLVEILQAGIEAPSGCNKQTTSFIAIDDVEVLNKLKNVLELPNVQTAPAFILVLTQKIISYRDKCFNVQDYSAAIENMLLAIKSLGYDSCWYEGHLTDDDYIGGRLAECLEVPDDYEVVCLLPVGIAAETPRKAGRKPFAERAWFNHFGNNI